MAERHALLLSDIHLPAGPSPYRDALLSLLHGPAREAHAVFLLGDIFEYWLGDDISMPLYRPVLDALRALSVRGVRLYFQHGNRDFLVSSAALRHTGMRLLPDPVAVSLPDGPALLSHGDIWCAQDISYQRWRRFAHSPAARRVFLSLPAALRRHIADRVRLTSERKGRGSPGAILDVTDDAIENAFRDHQVARIIHGHTHRPGSYDHRGGQRLVLPDWRPDAYGYLEVRPDAVLTRSMNLSW